jgi:hypothetical protein
MVTVMGLLLGRLLTPKLQQAEQLLHWCFQGAVEMLFVAAPKCACISS